MSAFGWAGGMAVAGAGGQGSEAGIAVAAVFAGILRFFAALVEDMSPSCWAAVAGARG